MYNRGDSEGCILHPWNFCELYGLYGRKLYGLYVDYTDYTMHIIVLINISSIIKLTCLYLQSCRSTRRSANTTHMLLLYKILQDHMMVEYKILLCHHLQANNVLISSWCTRASALMPFQAVSQTVKIALWMAARCDMWTLGHRDGLVICNEGLSHISGNFLQITKLLFWLYGLFALFWLY